MRRQLMAVVLLALAAACGADKAIDPGPAVNGTYVLQSVNGASLPALLIEDTEERDEVSAGTITLGADRTWNITLTLRVTDLTDNSVFNMPIGTGGTYTVSGSSVSLSGQGIGVVLNGTVAGAKLTVTGDVLGEASTLVFSK